MIETIQILTPDGMLLTVEFVDEEIDDEDEDDWYCLTTSEPCRKHNLACCHSKVGEIIVWPTIDDPNMLSYANFLKRRLVRTAIVVYENSFGHCISYYKLVR